MPWNDDLPADLPTLEANGASIVLSIVNRAQNRSALKRDQVKGWHIALLRGTHVPEPEYRGRFRGDRTTPKLEHYEVSVRTDAGRLQAVRARQVSGQVAAFFQQLRGKIELLDGKFPPGAILAPDGELEVIELAAWAHGEWVRIHPFANGNGRTARLIAVWVVVRYGLPAFLDARPRPRHPDFGSAASASMAGDHAAMMGVFVDLLIDYRSRLGKS